jgi:ABC-type multidrug transport system fused ATPase/permease subunit
LTAGPQESGLFNASIQENLLMVKPSATPEEIERALKAAGAYGFILGKSHASASSPEVSSSASPSRALSYGTRT